MLVSKTFLLFFLLYVNSEEPHCSKYDLFEKVLEKMVRIEFQMERMKSEMEQYVKTVENMKTETEAKQKTVEENLEKIKTLEKELLETLTLEQQSLEKKISGKIGALKNQTVALLSEKLQQLEKLKDEVKTPTVVFKALLTSDRAAPVGQTISFPVVLFNEGEAYNSGTGKFTAPVTGTYMFSMAFCLYSSKTLVAGIMVDGKKYTVTLFYGDSNHGCVSADTVAILTAGQMVWVEVLPGGSSGQILDQDVYRWNTFSGALVHN